MGKVFKSSFKAKSAAYDPFQLLLWFGMQILVVYMQWLRWAYHTIDFFRCPLCGPKKAPLSLQTRKCSFQSSIK